MMKKLKPNGKRMIPDGGMNILTDLFQKKNGKRSMASGTTSTREVIQ